MGGGVFEVKEKKRERDWKYIGEIWLTLEEVRAYYRGRKKTTVVPFDACNI